MTTSKCAIILFLCLLTACSGSNPAIDASRGDASRGDTTTNGYDGASNRDVFDSNIVDSSSGRVCYSSQGRFYDDCTDSSAFYPPKDAVVQHVGSRTFMYINTNFEVRVFDLANPSMPRIVADLLMPFAPGCGLPFGCMDNSDNHFQYQDTVRPVSVATLGGVGYAFVPLNSYGWDMLRATDSGITWFGTGNHVANGGDMIFYRSGALFVHDGHLFLVGQMLDRQSFMNMDRSVRIYDLGANPPEQLYSSLTRGVVLPLGPTASAPYNVSLRLGYQLTVREVDGRRVLFVSGQDYVASRTVTWLAAFDVTDPGMPVGVGFWSSMTDPNLFGSVHAFEESAQRLWVANVTGGSPARVAIRGYSIGIVGGQLRIDSLVDGTWPLGAQQGAGGAYLAAGYGLLAFGWMQVGKLFAISPSGTLTPLPDEPGYTDLSMNLQEPCQYWDLARGYMGLTVYRSPEGALYLYRSAMKEARMIQIANCE